METGPPGQHWMSRSPQPLAIDTGVFRWFRSAGGMLQQGLSSGVARGCHRSQPPLATRVRRRPPQRRGTSSARSAGRHPFP